MCVTDEKAVVVSGVECIARNRPVRICRIRQTPSRSQNFIMMRYLMG